MPTLHLQGNTRNEQPYNRENITLITLVDHNFTVISIRILQTTTIDIENEKTEPSGRADSWHRSLGRLRPWPGSTCLGFETLEVGCRVAGLFFQSSIGFRVTKFRARTTTRLQKQLKLSVLCPCTADNLLQNQVYPLDNRFSSPDPNLSASCSLSKVDTNKNIEYKTHRRHHAAEHCQGLLHRHDHHKHHHHPKPASATTTIYAPSASSGSVALNPNSSGSCIGLYRVSHWVLLTLYRLIGLRLELEMCGFFPQTLLYFLDPKPPTRMFNEKVLRAS